jgi:hypothetical protein
MNPPINERLAYASAAKANDKVELIAAQARELFNLRRLPALLTTAQTAASLWTEAASTTFRCWLVRAALAAWQPTAQCREVFRDCGGARTAADTKRLSQIRDVICEYRCSKNAPKPRTMVAPPAAVYRTTGKGDDRAASRTLRHKRCYDANSGQPEFASEHSTPNSSIWL